MALFDPSKTITLEPAAPFQSLPLASDRSKAAARLALQCLLFLVAASILLAGLAVLQTRGTYWVQSERNRYIAEMAAQSLQRAHDIAVDSATTTRWTQSLLGRDDTPTADGSLWSIHVADATVLGRGEVNANLGVRLHSPHGVVPFDARGHSIAGAVHLVIDSPEPGDIYAIDVSEAGSIVISRTAL